MAGRRTAEIMFMQALGQALRRSSANWSAQPECVRIDEPDLLNANKTTELNPGILIDDGLFPPIVIECSFSARAADRDAVARLGLETRKDRTRIVTIIALCIPNRFQEDGIPNIVDLLWAGVPIMYAVHQLKEGTRRIPGLRVEQRRWPQNGFIKGNVFDFLSFLSRIRLPQEDIDAVGERVAQLVEDAAGGLEAALSHVEQQEVAGHLYLHSPLGGLRTVTLLWLNALLTQQRLARQGIEEVPLISFMSKSLPNVIEQADVWRIINKHRQNSVFEPAIEALQLAGEFNPEETPQVLAKLIEATQEIETARLGLHINIGAELFPKLGADRKEAAAFYTQPATAELLADLTIDKSLLTEEEWGDSDLFRKHFLSDLSCGTGTLLRAGYHRVSTLHEHAGANIESLRSLHTAAVEGGIIGTDVNPIAAHLTMSSLSAMGYGDPYGNTQIGWVSVGGEKGQTGSLEYFATQRVVDLFSVGAGKFADNGAKNAVYVQDASIDWTLMNPPYSRTRGGLSAFDIGGLSEIERKACQRRWKSLVKNEAVNNRAGLAASFLALARQKCKPGGRIGFVLPLSAAFAESWAVTRRMIEQEFEDIIAITVADRRASAKQSLSADTGMEEMLFVGTKRSTRGHKGELSVANVYCVTLRQPVLRTGEAGVIARSIQSALKQIKASSITYSIRVGDDEAGQICTFTTKADGAPWNPLGVLHASLALTANALLEGVIRFDEHVASIGVPMSTIGDLFKVGPTHDLIGHLSGRDPRGAFELVPVVSPIDAIGPDRALWKADSHTQKYMTVSLTHKGMSPTGVGSDAKREAMRQFRSTLFYARNMRWTSQALLSAVTTYPGMGGSTWTSLQHDDQHVLKAFALWANSTLGFLVHWTQGQRTHKGRSRTQVKALAGIPCPTLDQIPKTRLKQAAAAFDEFSTQSLLPACQSHKDEVRKKIDRAVLKMLDLTGNNIPETVATVQWLWCNEPSVHGHNREALALLEPTLSRQQP